MNEEDVIVDGRVIRISVKEKSLTPTFILHCVSIVALAFAIGLLWFQGDDVQKTAENTNLVVKDIEERTTPEALAEQQSQIDAVIQRVVDEVECSEIGVVQQVLEALAAEGLIRPETATTVFAEDAARCPD